MGGKPISGVVIGAAYDVHNALGVGFVENVYKNALYLELKALGLKCECEKEIDVYYKGVVVGKFKADMVVEDKLILELKAVSNLLPAHEVQVSKLFKSNRNRKRITYQFRKECGSET